MEIEIKFSNGSRHQFPVLAVINHYAQFLLRSNLEKTFDDAAAAAAERFARKPEEILEYCSNAMEWIDVILIAEEINPLSIRQKAQEFRKADKTLVAPEPEE